MSNPKCLALNIESITKKFEYLKKRMFYHESQLLKCLEFNTSRILAIDFLNYFAEDADFNFKNKRYFYCLYLLNISYLDLKLRSVSQSLLAFSIVYFVNRIFSKDEEWPLTKNDSSTNNLLKMTTKKVAYLKVNDRFEEWNNVLANFHSKFASAMDHIVRIGDNPQKTLQTSYENRFLSRVSNSFIFDSRKNIQSDRSIDEKENCCPLVFVENSEKECIENSVQNRPVFTQKNLNKQKGENKSTGIPKKKPLHIPNKKISSFKLLIGKNLLSGRDQESLIDNGDIVRPQHVIYKEIEFDFSKVKSIAMDMFNGKCSFIVDTSFL